MAKIDPGWTPDFSQDQWPDEHKEWYGDWRRLHEARTDEIFEELENAYTRKPKDRQPRSMR